ncbi:hypothetical protein FF38_08093 [Lucilia cuprina]|uniref:Uncharacterized protein n=1 Tax=Lucilia cuprina TaxID=7375 RepID=A0A0L0BYL2_LUCCU|nr:hypothetical protein FF38_08093 [Lucilia cuprina]
MASVFLPHVPTGWHVDQAILSEEDKLVVIRFGNDALIECMQMDELLYGIAEQVRNFASIYICDTTEVPDFDELYELHDPMTLMRVSDGDDLNLGADDADWIAYFTAYG